MGPREPITPEQTVGILTVDTDLRVRSWDGWLERVTGIPASAAIGRSLTELVPDLENRGLLARLEQVLTEGAPVILSPAFHHYLIPCAPIIPSKHYQKMQQKVIIAPLREGARITGAVLTIEDVTARLDYERELAARMQEADEATRLEIARALASEEAEGAAPLLMDTLGDTYWHVRRVAVNGLVRHGDAEVIHAVLRTLRERHRDLGVLNSILEVLRGTDVDVLPPLVDLLAEPDAEIRTYVALTLGDLKDPRAIGPLLGLLTDADANVRYHAIEALGKLRASEAAEPLLHIAESGDFFLAFPALEALAQIGDASVAPRIVPLLENPTLAQAAITALAVLGDEAVVEPLVKLLNQKSAPAGLIASALVEVHNRYTVRFGEGEVIEAQVASTIKPEGIQHLIQALDEAEDAEMRALIRVLGWVKSPEAAQAVVRLLQNPDLRTEVVEALVRYGPRVTHLLTAQLLDGELETRQAAAVALGRIGDANAVPALIEALQDQPSLAVLAAEALAKIGDRRAFEALLGMLGHPQLVVRQAAVAALNSLGHPDMPRRLVPLLEDPNPWVRESAVKIAGYFGYPECVDLLLARCADPEPAVRRAAIEHLPYLDDPRVLPTLIGATQDEDPRTRASAVRALAHMQGIPVLEALLRALTDPDAWVRYFATRTLGTLRPVEALNDLARLAETDPSKHVRIAALEAIAAIGGPRAIALLCRVAESDDAELASAAIGVLGQIRHPDVLPPLLVFMRVPDPNKRRSAVRSLRDFGGPQAASALQWVAAAETDAQIAQEAVAALGELGTPEAVAGLLALSANVPLREMCIAQLTRLAGERLEWLARGLSHPHPAVRCATVEALARAKNAQATDQLILALSDSDSKVRLAATSALGHLGVKRAFQQLERLSREDPDPAVRNAARRALRV